MKKSPRPFCRRVISDADSDSALTARQNELHSLRHDLTSVIETITSFTSPPPVARDNFDDYQPDSNLTQLSVDVLIKQIQAMQTETARIAKILAHPRFTDNLRAHSIGKQLQYLRRMNIQLLSRATALLT